MEVTLHLLTERLSFVSAEADMPTPPSPLQNMLLTALKLQNFESFPIEVKSVSEGGRRLHVPGNRVIVHNPGRAGWLTMTGKALRLLDLPLAPGAQGRMSADPPDRMSVFFQNPAESQLTLAVQEALTLTLNNVVVQDTQGKPLLTGTSSRLELVPFTTNLVLTQKAGVAWELTLDVAQQMKSGTGGELPLPLFPRLKMQQVNMQRVEQNKSVSAVQRLWIESIIPEQEPMRSPVSVQLRAQDTFMLHSMVLTAQGLECTLVGTTSTVQVGKEKPWHNKIPSWLDYLMKHSLVEIWKLLKGSS